MKILFLAAGMGTRLRPLTDEVPKALVPFKGKPLLEYNLRTYRRMGLTDLNAVVGYKKEKFQDSQVRYIENVDFATTNMVHSLMCARELLESGDELIVSYSDIAYDKTVIEALMKTPGDIVVAIDKEWEKLWRMRMDDPLSDAETLKVKDGRITEIGKKVRSYDEIEGQYIGLFKLTAKGAKQMLAAYDQMDRQRIYDGKDFRNMFMTSFLQHLIDHGHDVKPAFFNGGWFEIDSLEDIRIYEQKADLFASFTKAE